MYSDVEYILSIRDKVRLTALFGNFFPERECPDCNMMIESINGSNARWKTKSYDSCSIPGDIQLHKHKSKNNEFSYILNRPTMSFL